MDEAITITSGYGWFTGNFRFEVRYDHAHMTYALDNESVDDTIYEIREQQGREVEAWFVDDEGQRSPWVFNAGEDE